MALVACSSNAPTPTPLGPDPGKIAGHQVWKSDFSNFGTQGVAAAGSNFVIAARDGRIEAVDAADGHELWRVSADGRLSTGVGSDGRFTAVVTRDGDLEVFEDGKQRWHRHIESAVVTAPFVAGERVFVLGVDRAVLAFDALDGTPIWTYARPGDALTLAEAGVLTSYKDTLLVGQGSRLTALDPLHGTVRWEVPVATPRGTNEVERLADLIGPAARVGDVYCIRAFENGVGCIDAERATALWSINGSGNQTVAADDEYVVSADGSDRIASRRRSNGESVWLSDKFQNRGLSGMLMVGRTVVFGDYQGWVHFLDRTTGEPLLRLPTDGSQIVGTPVVSGTTIAVTTAKGGLYAFRPE
ncbi:MAG TPA: PQQ-binding-like beta-propeller repeat protein [Burkholderiaceae bacterium]|nr:PQQ-binding-like beta-propeller repeat protein [Burkholderiaceae bacterium]